MNIIKKSIVALSAITAITLTGCGSTESSSTPVKQTVTGILADGAIGNASYECGATTGVTNRDGNFTCPEGSSIEFFFGNIKLGEVSTLPDDKIVLIQDILDVNRSDVNDTVVTRMAVFLQSLDEDDNHDNGIYLDPNDISSITSKTDFKTFDDTKVNNLISATGKRQVGEQEARNNLSETTNNVRDFKSIKGDSTLLDGIIEQSGVSTSGQEEGQDIAVDSDGNIYVVGTTDVNGNEDIIVRKYDSDGNLDTSFGTSGAYIYALAGTENGKDIIHDGSDSLYVVGDNLTLGIYLLKLNASTGALDTSFSSDGVVEYTDGSSFDAEKIVFYEDAIYIGNRYNVSLTQLNASILKYTTAGVLDTSFGSSGVFLNSIAGTTADGIFDMVIDSSGIYAVGYTYSSVASFIIYKIKSDGTLDTSFNSTGYYTESNILGGSGNDIGYDIEMIYDSLYVSGYSTGTGTNLGQFLMKFDKDGNKDTDFGTDGLVSTDEVTGRDTTQGNSLSSGNGYLYLVDYTNDGSNDVGTIWAYSQSGILKDNFATNGLLTVVTDNNNSLKFYGSTFANSRLYVTGEDLNSSNSYFGRIK